MKRPALEDQIKAVFKRLFEDGRVQPFDLVQRIAGVKVKKKPARPKKK